MSERMRSLKLVRRALTQPAELTELGGQEWDHLIRLLRAADLTARVAYLTQRAGVWDQLPLAPRRYLESGLRLVQRQQQELGFELRELDATLRSVGVPVVVLKGAAYVASGCDAAQGRIVSDVDVLVPRDLLSVVESTLMRAGWMSSATSAYDQRYYRTWMHELPPMVHIKRGTVLDVHHAIMPLSARVRPSTDLLLREARSLPGMDCLHVLSPVDMVLHSATHLMHEGEFERGLRGVVDLDALLSEHGAQRDFWPLLVSRALELQLTRPLFYALRYAAMLLGSRIPDDASAALSEVVGAHPGTWRLRWMDAMFTRVLCPPHALVADRWTPVARGFLYLRGHWLRMPPGLLTLHLLRKLLSPSSQGA